MAKQNITGEFGPYHYSVPEGDVGSYTQTQVSKLSKERYSILDKIAAIQENIEALTGHELQTQEAQVFLRVTKGQGTDKKFGYLLSKVVQIPDEDGELYEIPYPLRQGQHFNRHDAKTGIMSFQERNDSMVAATAGTQELIEGLGEPDPFG